MTQQNKILNYVLNSSEPVTPRGVMDNTKLPRAIVDKWLSVLSKRKICYRVALGSYFKAELTDYDIKKTENKRLRDNFPKLANVYHCAIQRCNNANHPDYKHYGLKGIRVEISLADLVEIFIRDKGYLLEKPSIDRIDSSKSYSLENTRFIEFAENIRRATKGKKKNKKPVLLLTYKGEIKNDLCNL
jgi:hypothetical protein